MCLIPGPVVSAMMAGQPGIWHAQQLDRDNPLYNVAEYWEFRGDFDPGLFQSAVRQVVAGLDVFHLRFGGEGERLWQWVEPRDDWPFHVVDVTGAADHVIEDGYSGPLVAAAVAKTYSRLVAGASAAGTLGTADLKAAARTLKTLDPGRWWNRCRERRGLW